MLFGATLALKKLETEFHFFYETSRIITKHAAHYEAEAMEKNIQTLLNSLTANNLEANLGKIISIHNSSLIMSMNFLTMTLEETQYIIVDDYMAEQCLTKSLAKSVSLVYNVIKLLKTYQEKFFDNLFKIDTLDASLAKIEAIRFLSENGLIPPVMQEDSPIFDVCNTVLLTLTFVDRYLKFTISYYRNKD
jgi:hypothetical protein